MHNEILILNAISAGVDVISAGGPIGARIQKLSFLRAKEVSFLGTPYLPSERAKTVISEFN